MNTFEKDFTRELEKCVAKGTADISVLTSWAPGRNAPLEVHVRHGIASHVPLESIHYQLRRNATFHQISNWLHMSFSESVIQQVSKMQVDDEKVQVWYFARWWFNSYVEYLLDPMTQRSQFYKERHEEFLALLRHMLEIVVSRRLTFRAALSAWHPDSDLLKTEDQSEDDDASDAEPECHRQPTTVVAVSATASPLTSGAVVPPSIGGTPSVGGNAVPPLSMSHRLVLKGWSGHGVRSKTRRNLCS
jgi:hypothetical protein